MKYFVDVILVFLSPVFLSERLPVLCFGGGSHMPVSVGPCLHYVHHSAAGLGVPPEVVRITSYQHPSQARYRMFQFHFSHSFLNSYFLILNSARFCIRQVWRIGRLALFVYARAANSRRFLFLNSSFSPPSPPSKGGWGVSRGRPLPKSTTKIIQKNESGRLTLIFLKKTAIASDHSLHIGRTSPVRPRT